jgi:hypothetical protein
MLENLKIPIKNYTCRVATVLSELEDKDKKILADAVMSDEWPIGTLENSLRKLGVTLSGTSIKRHRTKGCSCWKA